MRPTVTSAQSASGRLPSEAYDEGVERGEWQDDAAQRAVLPTLDRIHKEISARGRGGFIERLARRLRGPRALRGVYLHGGVGRGKTFLLDLLHDSLPEALRQRLHFHRFMLRVHAELAQLKHTPDPLATVARAFAQRPLLCLDEFFVHDIADAMILAQLLRHFVAAGGSLATTSNTAPPMLYRDGLQRAKFLPAIALIERRCTVLHLDTPTDYRLRALTAAPVYLTPVGAAADAALGAIFDRVAPGSTRPEPAMMVNDRPIALRKRADGVAWFDFTALCEGPRSVADYVELARSYNTLLVSNVPQFSASTDDAAKRFVHLVDELYDRNVNLVLSAAAPAVVLYRGARLAHEFARTASRLIEMQSTEYLARAHRP